VISHPIDGRPLVLAGGEDGPEPQEPG